MFRVSAQFQQALHHTFVLTATALAMIFLWSGRLLPQANLLLVVFAFLSAVRLSGIASQELRLRLLSGMLISATLLQYIVSVTGNLPLLHVLLPAAASWIILLKLPESSAYPVLLTGFLAYSAEPGVYAAAERAADLLFSGVTAWFISSLNSTKNPFAQAANSEKNLPPQKAFIESLTIFCAAFLYKLLSIPQGIWIVLTVIFIYMVQQPEDDILFLAKQRIFSVPAGIMLGGLYSGAVVMFDYRLAYLAVLFGATGFFMLYYRHDFFYFSLFFMFAFTVGADWMSGALRDFHFMQFLFARSLATAIGTILLLVIEKTAANLPERITAS
ncbi:MAG: hypothetical protein J6S19_01815 [Lentisphaeria bacterium]|nr:hypothetical protein [Lentisphaeria bacterium]